MIIKLSWQLVEGNYGRIMVDFTTESKKDRECLARFCFKGDTTFSSNLDHSNAPFEALLPLSQYLELEKELYGEKP